MTPNPALWPAAGGKGQDVSLPSYATLPQIAVRARSHTVRARSLVLPRGGVGPTLRSAVASEAQGQLCTAIGCERGARQQPRPGMTSWILVVIGDTDISTDPCCCMATDPDRARSTGWDLAMASEGSAGYSHQTVPHHPRVSDSASLHSSQTGPLFLPSLHHILALCSGSPWGRVTWRWAGLSKFV